MTTKTTWPYDAAQDDPLTALRIPVVASAWPQWNYITAFDGSSPARPTDPEAAMIASFTCAYIDYWYNETWKRRLAERPFDIDGGANGVVFYKWAEDDWGYRRSSWTVGPLYWPGLPSRDGRKAHSLAELMDHVHTSVERVTPRWLEWKAAHPEVFGG